MLNFIFNNWKWITVVAVILFFLGRSFYRWFLRKRLERSLKESGLVSRESGYVRLNGSHIKLYHYLISSHELNQRVSHYGDILKFPFVEARYIPRAFFFFGDYILIVKNKLPTNVFLFPKNKVFKEGLYAGKDQSAKDLPPLNSTAQPNELCSELEVATRR